MRYSSTPKVLESFLTCPSHPDWGLYETIACYFTSNKLLCLGNEGHWTWSHSGEDAIESFWGTNRPNNKSGNTDDCGVMVLQRDNFWWEDRSCLSQDVQKKTVAPICQHDSDAASTTDTPPTPTTTAFSCPSGWEESNGHCYQLSTTLMSWANAESFCISKGGHLASVHSLAEETIINSLVPASTSITWLGATDRLSEVGNLIFILTF